MPLPNRRSATGKDEVRPACGARGTRDSAHGAGWPARPRRHAVSHCRPGLSVARRTPRGATRDRKRVGDEEGQEGRHGEQKLSGILFVMGKGLRAVMGGWLAPERARVTLDHGEWLGVENDS